MIQGQSWSVPMAHLWLLFKKMGYQEENYNFWDFSTAIFDIKYWHWMKLAPVLVPLEVWFWYMLFFNQHSMTSKILSQIFSVMFQSLLKPHYVYTAWLHKISPTLIVCRICSINSIRNLRHSFADNRSKNNIYQNQTSRGTNTGANFIQCNTIKVGEILWSQAVYT
jgi:hypothetical protein